MRSYAATEGGLESSSSVDWGAIASDQGNSTHRLCDPLCLSGGESGHGIGTGGHVSVCRARILSSAESGGLGLEWRDLKHGTLAVAEDVRFIKEVRGWMRKLGKWQLQRSSCFTLVQVFAGLGRANTTAALVGARLSLYQPSWAASKRCVAGPYILFDCHVTWTTAGDGNRVPKVRTETLPAPLPFPPMHQRRLCSPSRVR